MKKCKKLVFTYFHFLDAFERFERLLQGHIAPLIDMLGCVSGASPKVFWSNFGGYFDYFARGAHTHPMGSPDAAEQALRLLDHRVYPDGRRKDTVINAEKTGWVVWNMVTFDLKDAMNPSAMAVPYGESEISGIIQSLNLKIFSLDKLKSKSFDGKKINTMHLLIQKNK